MKTCHTPIYPFIGIFLLMCMLCGSASATHLRAGEITLRRTDPLTFDYEVTLHIYGDRSSNVIVGSNGTLDFGDGTIRTLTNNGDPSNPDYISRTQLTYDTWLYELKVVHRFPAAGTYTVSYKEDFRNSEILNMDNSVNMPFYIQSTIVIDPSLGPNSSPKFKLAGFSIGVVGKTYHHQAGAYDADGDSLSYDLVISRQSRNLPVSNYRYPHQTFPAGDVRGGSNEEGGGALLSLNPRTGDLIWDAPGTQGQYTVAIMVKEWRKLGNSYYNIGSVIRDMQIVVEEQGEPSYPELEMTKEGTTSSPEAGEKVSWTITATAPNPEEEVSLAIGGDFLSRTNAVATATETQGTGQASITISWTGEGNQGQNYQLIATSSLPGSAYARTSSQYIYYNPNALGLGDSPVAKVSVHPNPLTGSAFHISLPEAPGQKITLKVYDMQGKLVKQDSGMLLQETYSLYLDNPKPGIYLLYLQYGGKNYQNKLVVR